MRYILAGLMLIVCYGIYVIVRDMNRFIIVPYEVKSKKIKKIWWRRTTNVLSACQVSLGNDIHGSRGKKIIYFGVLIVFFAAAPTNVIP